MSSIKFEIKNTPGPAEREGDVIVRFSGTSEPFKRSTDRQVRKIGVDGKGEPRLIFNTGLEEKQVDQYTWYTPDERTAVKETIKELKPFITKYYGGEEVIDRSNLFFWGSENRDINKLSLTNEDIGTFFDTEKATHALLYLSIISGAFIEVVAPTREWAERHQIPHYLSLESETTDYSEENDITKSDAHAALSYLRHEQPDGLFILAWCIQYDTNGYGAYSKSTSQKDLINYHIKFIEGKLVSKKKKNCPKVFMDYVEKWKGQQTRPALFVEAYVKAGDFYSFIRPQEKKFVTQDGTVLGNTISDAIATLLKPKFSGDLEKLRGLVEAKWNE